MRFATSDGQSIVTIMVQRQSVTNDINLKDCIWKQRTHKIITIGDAVLARIQQCSFRGCIRTPSRPLLPSTGLTVFNLQRNRNRHNDPRANKI